MQSPTIFICDEGTNEEFKNKASLKKGLDIIKKNSIQQSTKYKNNPSPSLYLLTLDNMSISSQPFGKVQNEPVFKYTLINSLGMSVSILTYGAILQSLYVPDRNGTIEDAVLGFNTLEKYIQSDLYFGATCGRYANRIQNGSFELDSKKYTLNINNGAHSLHGGSQGFDQKLWEVQNIKELSDKSSLSLKTLSLDGEEGYPGTLTLIVTFTLFQNINKLQIDYHATTSDKSTIINITNHSYFNLSGNLSCSIRNHIVQILADRYCVVNGDAIPTGELRSVSLDSEMDFLQPKQIEDEIDSVQGLGYDHCYCFDHDSDKTLNTVAIVVEPQSGRRLICQTTQPGLQFYTGNYIPNDLIGKNNLSYQKQCGFCLETQHYPDSPNQPSFPSTVLRNNEEYQHSCVYQFDTVTQ